MPTYEYECRNCNHRFDVFQPITAQPLKTCPKCKQAKLRRLIGKGAGIIFKGTGFYQTDYRSAHYRKQSAAEKPGADASKPGADASKPGADASKPASKEVTKAMGPTKPEKTGSSSAP